MHTSHPYGLRHWEESFADLRPALDYSESQKTFGTQLVFKCRPAIKLRAGANRSMAISSFKRKKRRFQTHVTHGRGASSKNVTPWRYVKGWVSVQSGLVVSNQPQYGLAVPAKIIQRLYARRRPRRLEACNNSPAPACARPLSRQSDASSSMPSFGTIS